MPQTPDFRVDVVGHERNPYGNLFPMDRSIFPGLGKNYEREPHPEYVNRSRPRDETQPTVAEDEEKPNPPLGGSGGGFDLVALLKLLAGMGLTVAGLTRSSPTSTPTTTDAALADILKLQQGRLTKSEPLYDAILKMSGALMPTAHQPTWPATTTPPPTDNLAQTRPGQSNYPGGSGIDLDGKRRG